MKKVFREITADEFEEFVAACPVKSYMQSLPMYRRYQKIGRESYLLGGFYNGKLVVAGLASQIYQRLGRKVFTFSRGPLADYKKATNIAYFLDETKKFLKHKGGMALQISPNLLIGDAPRGFDFQLDSCGFKSLGEYEQVRWIYVINFAKYPNLPHQTPAKKRSAIFTPPLLSEQTSALSSLLHTNHRRMIRAATERYGLKLRELPVSEYQTLCNLIDESGKYQGFTFRNVEFYRQMKEFFGDEVAAIVAETPDGQPIAAAFFILYGDEVIYLSGGFDRTYKKFGAPHLIQWTMIQFAYANGYRQYNFWGTNPNPNNGVYKFKQGFQGTLEEFVGTYAAPLNLLGRAYVAKIKYQEQRDL